MSGSNRRHAHFICLVCISKTKIVQILLLFRFWACLEPKQIIFWWRVFSFDDPATKVIRKFQLWKLCWLVEICKRGIGFCYKFLEVSEVACWQCQTLVGTLWSWAKKDFVVSEKVSFDGKSWSCSRLVDAFSVPEKNFLPLILDVPKEVARKSYFFDKSFRRSRKGNFVFQKMIL